MEDNYIANQTSSENITTGISNLSSSINHLLFDAIEKKAVRHAGREENLEELHGAPLEEKQIDLGPSYQSKQSELKRNIAKLVEDAIDLRISVKECIDLIERGARFQSA
jgi:hypothetical protein